MSSSKKIDSENWKKILRQVFICLRVGGGGE